mgnify:FL=1|jgi:hypothetical protein
MKKMMLFLFFIVSGARATSYAQPMQPLLSDNAPYLSAGKYMNAVNTRALRDFMHKYESATDISWYNLETGYLVRFVQDGVQMRAVYGKRGNWVYTIKSYYEDRLPHAVRHVVKSNYYDCAIRFVEEIEQPRERVSYIVHLEDKTSWRNVIVQDGHLAVMQEYTKPEQ